VSHTHTATSTVTDPTHTHVQNGQAIGGGSVQIAGGAAAGLQTVSTQAASTGISVATSIASSGSSGTNANLQPYIVVYMWNRTA